MSQIDKMNQVYEQVKTEVKNNYSYNHEVKDFLNSPMAQKMISEANLVFPFQYSGDEGIYFFGDVEAFQDYVMEKLTEDDVIVSDDDYESSEEWESSSC